MKEKHLLKLLTKSNPQNMEREVYIYNTSSAIAAKLAGKTKKTIRKCCDIILRFVYKYPLTHHDPLLILRHYKRGKQHKMSLFVMKRQIPLYVQYTRTGYRLTRL
jgi:hypothetical protein